MGKKDLVQKILCSLENELHILDQSASDAEDESWQEKDVPASQVDHRSLEAGLLAKAQSVRANAARNQLATLKSFPIKDFKREEDIGLSALIELEHNGQVNYYFLSPQGGGLSIDFEGHKVEVITPHSPLGEELLEKRVDDEIIIESPKGLVEYKVRSVS